jgi:uncharacterized protein (TIGR03437 family)
MVRKKKIYIAKTAVILGVIPVLIFAHEYGPDAGYANVPGENGTCAQSGCHVGRADDPANKGSVTVAFPNGTTYTPGTKQHLIVTIADPAATQKAWGFELTARSSSNSTSQAGAFVSTNANTALICSSNPIVDTGTQVSYSSSGEQVCPSGKTLQYIEHSLTGYNATRGHTGSQTYEFDWTPPSSNVGNIVIYLAGNAANGDLLPTGDHIYTNKYTLTAAASGPTPTIDTSLSVQNQTSAPNAKGQAVAAGSLVAVYGTNFATAAAAAANIPLPATLAGVGVTFNGTAAPMVGIAPGLTIGGQTVDQINAIVPWGIQPGNAQVVVTRNGAPSTAVTVPIAATGPGIFYIATDSTGVNRPLAYNNSDNTFSYPAGIFGANLKTRASSIKSDVIVLWCTGLGPVTVTPPNGAPATDAKGNFVESDTTTKPVVMVGGIQANVLFSGLTQYPSIYQINLTMATGTPTGDAVPIQIQMNGVTTTDQFKIAVTN